MSCGYLMFYCQGSWNYWYFTSEMIWKKELYHFPSILEYNFHAVDTNSWKKHFLMRIVCSKPYLNNRNAECQQKYK